MPQWIELFPVASTGYQHKNYCLDLSSKPELSLIYNNFYIRKLKPYLKNNDNKFQLRRVSEPGLVEDNRYEVQKVLEYPTAPRTGQPSYKVAWFGYRYNHD